MHQPIVTIGLPTFNAETTINRALESILDQSYGRWVLNISDDNSTDDTKKIISTYAASFPDRIKILNSREKLYYMNFRHLLDSAQTPYFVWLAGDDWWEPTFLEDCINKLEADPNAVCCVGRCLFHNPDGSSYRDPGCEPLVGDMAERMSVYLRAPDQTRMYGIFRHEVLTASFPPAPFHAYDWALCLGTLRFGTHLTVDKHLMNREKSPTRSYLEAVKRDEPNLFYQLFPILRMSLWLIRTRTATSDALVFFKLLRLNISKHEQQVKFFNPRVFQMLRPMYWMVQKSISLGERSVRAWRQR
jgi:glycosyltransferase involved in cell wall biosynthesis